MSGHFLVDVRNCMWMNVYHEGGWWKLYAYILNPEGG